MSLPEPRINNRHSKASLESFARMMVSAYETSNPKRPVVPAGKREALDSLLTHVFLDHDTCSAYIAVLTDVRRERGVHRELLAAGGPELPLVELAAHGPKALSDPQLADLALSPDALTTARTYLYDDESLDPHRGRWFFEEPSPLPAPATQPMSAPSSASVTTPSVIQRERTSGRMIGYFLALAASVFGIGIGLGNWLKPSPREVAMLTPEELAEKLPDTTRDALLKRWGSSGPSGAFRSRESTIPAIVRGPDDFDFEIRNEDQRRFFVTIVGLASGARPVIQAKVPQDGKDEWLALAPGETKTVIPSRPLESASSYLLVMTITPAQDVIRDLLPNRASPTDIAAIQQKLEQELPKLGFTHSAFKVVQAPAKTHGKARDKKGDGKH